MAGIYIHIPLCASRCSYCDFYSTTDFSLKDELVEALCLELSQQQNYISDKCIDTIYFGGGTPSLLSEANFKRIFDTISSLYDLSSCKEITLEANPDDLTPDYISMLRCLPFNRISIGIQSLLDSELQMINRRHSAEQAIACVAACNAAGLQNVSVDLIYGYPSQSLSDFEYSIDKVLNMNVKHISAYHLTYEKGTVLYQKLQQKEISPVDEEESLKMYHLLVEKLAQKGIIQYEISNFAIPGFESKHNSSYWLGKQYLGVGPSAHSYNGENRKWNISSLKDYLNGIKTGGVISEIEQLTPADCYNDFIITSLRTIQGLNLLELKNKFGEAMYNYCLENADNYLVNKYLLIDEPFMKCTQEGFIISDRIMAELLYVD